ncbi:dephospho-CoA kinase [Radiobacillus sp. PE A8.2]|uniref:dephospho-CoA kinase n=1 Tax=Radiobacillus sp. PE A8.2 TaxID=3380349 RepID=UPI00388F54DE
MTIVIGLTGSIATGKTTVANMFEKWDIPVIDADKIARQVVEPGMPAYQQIIDYFGDVILLESKQIDRKKLGQIVFSDESMRQQLNQIVHPAVREQMLKQRDMLVDEGKKAVVMDIPLLFESKLTKLVDKILVVFVEVDIQLKRLVERDHLTKEDALNRVRAQIPGREKAEMADAIIYNDRTLAESEQQLITILSKWEVATFS